MLRQIRDQRNIWLVNLPFLDEVLANKGTKSPRKLKLTISTVSGEGFMFLTVPLILLSVANNKKCQASTWKVSEILEM